MPGRSDQSGKRERVRPWALLRAVLAALIAYGPLAVLIVAAFHLQEMSDTFVFLLSQRVFDEQLWSAAQCGDADGAEAALAAGANINARNPMDNSALLIAACANRSEVARMLVRRGAQVSVFNRGYGSPLSQAVRHDDAPLVETLLKAGADPCRTEDGGPTAMQIGMASANPQMRDLIERACAERGPRPGPP